MPPTPALLALLCGAMLGLSATAQLRPDPLDARAAVPPAVHKPAVASPKPADDPPPADWRAANERVARVGGWRTYARETLPPEGAR